MPAAGGGGEDGGGALLIPFLSSPGVNSANFKNFFLGRLCDVGHHKAQGRTFLRAGVSFLSFHTAYLLHAAD